MYCNKCGAENLEGSAFCSSCGNKIEKISNNIIEGSTNTNIPNIQSNEQSKVNIQVAPILSNDEINTISINVFLDTNGVAHISELWYVDILEDTKATEGYRSFPKTTNITNLVVKENDNLYTILDNWDISGNLDAKKNKAGINKTDNKIEIYWGIGEYGIHKYEINYEVTNFLTELNDSQIMVSPILPTGMSKFENVNIKIYSDFKYKDIEIYTFGKDSATNKIQNGYIEIETNGSMNDSEYLTILAKFPLKIFNLENKYEDNFNNILPFVDKNIKYSDKLDDTIKESNKLQNNTITEQYKAENITDKLSNNVNNQTLNSKKTKVSKISNAFFLMVMIIGGIAMLLFNTFNSSSTNNTYTQNKIEDNINVQEKYNEKYSAELDKIFSTEIKVELHINYDANYTYIPTNLNTGKGYLKTQVEYVTINESTNQIDEIYFYVEMYLTVRSNYKGKTVSEGITKKYYKATNVDEIQEINNYNDQVISDELMNIIEGKINKILAFPSENNNYKYNFLNVKK